MKPTPQTPDLLDQLYDLFTKINPDYYYYNSDEDNAPIGWDWPGWLAPGYLTILTGQPGAGKSSLSLYLAISYRSGRSWPDGIPFTATPGKTLWIESEEDPRLHLQRLRAWCLDPRQVVTLAFTLRLPQPRPYLDLSRRSDFHRLIEIATRPDIRLIVLDSLSDLLAGDTRPRLIQDLLITFAKIARFLDKPILITHNLPQPLIFDSHGRVNLPRLLGPGISRLPRLIWGLDLPDPADPEHRRLSVIKNLVLANFVAKR